MGHNNVHASVRPMFIDRLRRYLDRHVIPNILAEKNMPRIGSSLPKMISSENRTRPKKKQQLVQARLAVDYVA
jgi:hypothetical protein